MRPLPSTEACREARRLIGVEEGATPDQAKAAFRAAIKAARPDLPGGDAERFRALIAAWEIVKNDDQVRTKPDLTAPFAVAPSPLVVVIAPLQALTGCRVRVEHEGRTLKLAVPPGVRSGEQVTFESAGDDGCDLMAPVLIRPSDKYSVLGDDLYMDWEASPRLLDEGGRVEVQTHAGARSAWVTPGLRAPVRLRLRDLGLPARGGHPQGHLFVTLRPSAHAPTPAELLRDRFCQDWTSQPAFILA